MKLNLVLLCILGTFATSFAQSNTKEKQTQEQLNGAPPAQNNSFEIKSAESPATNQSAPPPVEESHDVDKQQTKKSVIPTAQISLQQQQFSQIHQRAMHQNFSRTPALPDQEEMNRVVQYFAKNAPTSFEYHFYKYVAGNYDVRLIQHLNQAEKLKPNNSDVLVQKAAYGWIVSDSAVANLYLKKLVKISKLDPDVLNYDLQMLKSLPSNSVLLTHGFDDGFGAYYWNRVQNTRSDVCVLSLDLMQSEVYRDSLIKKGFEFPTSRVIDVEFFKAFCTLNADHQLFVSMTFPKPYLEAIQSDLSVHGLTFAYGVNQRRQLEMSEVIRTNEILWETQFKSSIQQPTYGEKGNQLLANYLPMLFLLRAHYKQSGTTLKLDEIEKMIDLAAIASNRYEKVKQLRR